MGGNSHFTSKASRNTKHACRENLRETGGERKRRRYLQIMRHASSREVPGRNFGDGQITINQNVNYKN